MMPALDPSANMVAIRLAIAMRLATLALHFLQPTHSLGILPPQREHMLLSPQNFRTSAMMPLLCHQISSASLLRSAALAWRRLSLPLLVWLLVWLWPPPPPPPLLPP